MTLFISGVASPAYFTREYSNGREIASAADLTITAMA